MSVLADRRGRTTVANVGRILATLGGVSALPVSGEQPKERADSESVLGAMTERAVWVHGVPVAAPDPGPRDVARRLQVGHDGQYRVLTQPSGNGNIAGPGLRVTGNLYQHMPVPGIRHAPSARGASPSCGQRPRGDSFSPRHR
jgi:hypothetical protein